MEKPTRRTCMLCSRMLCHHHQLFASLLLTLFVLLYPPCVRSQLIEHKDYPPSMFYQEPLSGSPKAIGSLKLLQCYANGDPSPYYRWLKDGEYTTGNITDTTLRIDNIQRSNAGNYQCLAINAHGALLSDRVYIYVAYMIPFAFTGNQDKVVDQGQERIIDLPTINSYPPPTITWDVWADGNWERIPTEGQRYHMTVRKQLVILETRLSSDNNKMFRARALLTQTGEESDSQTFVLKVQNVGSLTNDIPPKIVVPPSHTTAVQGDDAVLLECVANARPLNYLSLKWYRQKDNGDRVLIEPDNAKYLLPMYRRRLTILNPVRDDSGTYLCEASFSRPRGADLPTALAQANLTVLVKPSYVTPPPADIIQDVSTTVIIPCVANGIPSPTVRWYRNGIHIDGDEHSRYLVLSSGNIQISSAEAIDSGMFQCFVMNTAGEINRATWVRVRSFPPEILEPPQNQTVIQGELARFPCTNNGAPKPNLRWYRVTAANQNVEFDLLGNIGRIELLDDKILIPVTVVEDTGRYVCNVSNSLGYAFAEAWLKVIVKTKITNPPQDVEVIKGSTTVLQCGVLHDPNVTVYWLWYHKNVQIDPATDVRRQIREDGSLEIQAVRNEDIGLFRCDVYSTGGNDTAEADLAVIEIPYAPSVTGEALNLIDSKAVDVMWSPGFDGNSPIQGYIMQRRMKPPGLTLLPEEGWVEVASNIVPHARLHTVTGLLPSRSYQFRVAAKNAVGRGPPSVPSGDIKIPQQPPSGPPRGVVASPRSNSSLLIQWQPPEEEHWNGPLLGYTIRFKPSGYPDSTLEHKNITNFLITTDTLTGMIVWQEYEISVAAYNGKGVGVYGTLVYVRTQEGSPTAPPYNLTSHAESSTTIKLTWMPPDPQYINGINQGYKINASPVNRPEIVVTVTVLSDPSNMLGKQEGYLHELNKYTEHRITVLCFTAQGNGPSSSPRREMTLQDVPDQVANLSFHNILDTSLQVRWTKPTNINGILTNYTLNYQKKDLPITKVTKMLLPTTHSYVITDLAATTLYTIEVFASTQVGAGPVRAADIESGIPPVKPEPPTNLAVTNIKETSVILQFAPGFNGHTSISLWVVEEQSSEADPWEKVYEESAPDATSLLVNGLKPYTVYRLRMIAENIANRSDASQPTYWFETIQAPPYNAPDGVLMRAINETALRVGWTPLTVDEWNGEQRGYSITYRTVGPENDTKVITIMDEDANSHVIGGLEEWMEYELTVRAFNAMGFSPYSETVVDRTWEAVPSAGPSDVSVAAVTSTSIKVIWDNVSYTSQNGPILGYKVQYQSVEENIEPIMKVINVSTVREVMLTGLRKYVWYEIKMLAYTRIGDGMLSEPPQRIRTFEDVPGAPCCVYFPEVSSSSANVIWGPPAEPNGIISGYRVGYRQKQQTPDEEIIDDMLGPDRREFSVTMLQRNTYYVFSVTAKTSSMGWGVRNELEVYTILNRREPDPPTQPQIMDTQIEDRQVIVNWQPSSDGFGPIRNYTVQVQQDENVWLTENAYIMHNATSFLVTGLQPYTRYRFRVAANNDIGQSLFSEASRQVLTKQAAPESPPLNLKVIPQTRTSVYVSWEIPPVASWNGHLSGYQLHHRDADLSPAWTNTKIYNPDMEYKNVTGLQLFKTYEFRIRAFNMFGSSLWSPVAVVYLEMGASRRKLLPPNQTWNVDLDTGCGTEVWYSIVTYADVHRTKGIVQSQLNIVTYPGTTTNLSQLTIGEVYEVRLAAYNFWGRGPLTAPYNVYVGEAVPTGAPRGVELDTLSSTEIQILWSQPPPDSTNGDLKGYKIYYWKSSDDSSNGKLKQVAATQTDLIIGDLLMYTEYSVVLLAHNAAGDGPNITEPVKNRTSQGVPGAPDHINFVVISLSEVNASWSPPSQPNGLIQKYEVSYREVTPDGDSRHVQEVLPGTKHYYLASSLRQNVMYQFSVRARTTVDWGHTVSRNITIGPHVGSPEKPGVPVHTPGESSVTLIWVNDGHGISNITGYIIQASERGGPEWVTMVNSNSPEPTAIISYNKLKPETEYQFRVIAINNNGISEPSEPSEYLKSWDVEGEDEPFHQKWWFLVIVALIGVIVIILVVFLLCLLGRRKKASKYPKDGQQTVRAPPFPPSAPAPSLPRSMIQLTDNGSSPDDEAGFATFDDHRSTRHSARSQRSTRSQRGPVRHTLQRNGAIGGYAKSPPRPSPGSVNYSDDDYKNFADDDSSGTTEKPSEYSDSGNSNASDSDLEEKELPPPPFPVQYPSNGDVRHSWKGPYNGYSQQTSQPDTHTSNNSPYNSYTSYNAAYNYTDSEQDSQTYAMSMNGGHVIMNNMARSRAPLPGFSSFV